MKAFRWDARKNEKLKLERGISFEEIEYYISSGHVIDITENQNYKDQQIYVLLINDYIYLVPFLETDNEIILMTIFKSRKAKRLYFKDKRLKNE
jgi:uncharacterized DUF497 family protein